MDDDLFWICKDASSTSLTQSSTHVETKIRRHVQSRRQPRNDTSRDRRGEVKGSFGQINLRSRKKSKEKATTAPLSMRPLTYAWSNSCLGIAERRSLAFFQSRTSQDFSGWLDYDFWNVLVLQLAQQSTAITQSLIALAALHESIDYRSQSYDSINHLERLSRVQSSKAIEAAKRPDLTYLEALTSCLVILCYQSLQQCPYAFRLLKAGCKMLEEFDRQVDRQDAMTVELRIKPLFKRLQCRICGIGDALVSLRMSQQHSEKPSRLASSSTPLISTSFENLHEAQAALRSIYDWYQSASILPQDIEHSTLR